MTKRVQLISGLPQSDWNQTDETKPDYIKNKPVIGEPALMDWTKQYIIDFMKTTVITIEEDDGSISYEINAEENMVSTVQNDYGDTIIIGG